MQVNFKSDIGKIRQSNQDACNGGLFSDGCAWVVVCDGMGGHNAGDIASQSCVDMISNLITQRYNSYINDEEIIEIMKDIAVATNEYIYNMQLQDERLRGMGTTLEFVIARANKMYIVHAGDSRIYKLNNDEIMQITTDHSWVQQMVDLGYLTLEQARKHPNRNCITRAIGISENIEIDSMISEYSEKDLILICTDGLSNYFGSNELMQKVYENIQEDTIGKLIEDAKNMGGSDNITVAIISP